MSSSPDGRQVLYRAVDRPELRTGVWTRLGDKAVLGDEVTEAALGSLAERTHSAARAQGYAVGWAEGRQEALVRMSEVEATAEQRHHDEEERREEEHRAAAAALADAADALRRAAADATAMIAEQATELAFELTRTLVGHELSAAADPGAAVIARVLATLPDDPSTVVRVGTATADSHAAVLLQEHGVRLVVDPDLGPGDAVVETDTAAIDLCVPSALARLREVLR
ncbi:FliH/SctL family protein [Nocardioides sp.]|uniref:FliH/SctL family protein n=1 Tax=Nocardioides sp. TaxID=35761 RepID=UPI0025F33225|nr:FliH/SctL family protein [Nocardioides sp.]